jgi:hypothetical protein
MQCDEGFLGFGLMDKFFFFFPFNFAGLATADAVAIYTIILVLDVLSFSRMLHRRVLL